MDGYIDDNIQFPLAVTEVAAGSVRGNGTQDLVVLASDEVFDVLGNGNFTFQSSTSVGTSIFGVSSLALSDFNGDGKLDIAASNLAGEFGGAPSVSVLPGNGDGTFGAPVTTEVGESATALAVGAFNTAGQSDLVLATNNGSNSVTVLPGNGNGTFAATQIVTASNLPTAIASGDFNGDGLADLVVAGDGGTLVLLSNGNGTFTQSASLSLGNGSIPTAVVVGDFNGDGKEDIALGTGGKIDIFLGNGNGTFQTPKVINLGITTTVQSMTTGDFNGDGKLDLAVTTVLSGKVTGQVLVFTGNGNGTFKKTATINIGTDPEGLAAADFNGDGKLDLVTTVMLHSALRSADVLLGNGNGTFQAPIVSATGGSPHSVAVGDFNGDGKPDLVLGDNFNASIDVLLGNGNGTFGPPTVLKVGIPDSVVETPVVADFTGDGKQDIALTTNQGEVTVFQGNGDGTFQAPVNYLVGYHGSQPSGLAVGDFNGDGKLDLAATDFLANDVSLLLNNSPAVVVGTPITTTTTLTSNANPAVFGQPVTLTATVTSTDGTPTGSVTFFDGSTVLGTVAVDPNGQARLLVEPGVIGLNSITATFEGTGNFQKSTSAVLSETVNQDNTVSTLSASFITSTIVTLTDTVAPAAPGIVFPTAGTVTFYDGTTVVGTASVTQASVTLEGLSAGTHTLTAVYGGDTDFLGSTSNALVITIA